MIDSVSEQAGGLADLRRGRRKKPTALNTDRLPPHAPEAEQGVIGCILLSPQDCVPLCIAKLRAGADVFYDLRHQTIYTALVEMYDGREPIDVITVQQRLKDRQLLEQVGGIPYLNALQDAVPSAANVDYYAEIVLEKFVLRKLVGTCSDVVARVYEFEGEVAPLLDEAERDLLAVGQLLEVEQSDTVRASVPRALTMIERAFESQGSVQGLATGFTDLDRLTDGLHAGEMIVIAGRPSTGKTSLAMNIAEHVVLTLRLPVGVFSLEMTLDQLVLRVLCSNARVNYRSIRDGFMTEADFPRLTSAAGRIQSAPLFIDDTSGLSILQLRARARRMHQQHGIRLLVIDYLQLLNSNTPRAKDNRVQEVTEISNGVKALAKELGIPVIVLSQLNREMEKNKRRPRLSDLRESGAIEQDADVVGLLYRPDEDDEPSTQAEADAGYGVNLHIAKQRNGEAGVDVAFTFLKQYTRFEAAARVSAEDVPPARTQGAMPYADG